MAAPLPATRVRALGPGVSPWPPCPLLLLPADAPCYRSLLLAAHALTLAVAIAMAERPCSLCVCVCVVCIQRVCVSVCVVAAGSLDEAGFLVS